MSPWLRVRSAADRWLAALLLVVTAPLLGAVAAAVRWRDGSPVFIRLTRVGVRGTRFGMWKVRTMRAARAPDGSTASIGSAGGASITAGTDPRVTPLGARLRRHRIDELPNLLNVTAGQMALLGPRPETPGMVDAMDPRWDRVLEARPAIAGPTQLLCADWEAAELRHGDAEDVYQHKILPVKLAIDAWYVEAATARVDAEVLISLFQRFVLGRDETVVHRRVRREVPAAAAVPAATSRAGGGRVPDAGDGSSP
jgi:lipopolysaccharide/colanic/teichoic acid biosynthesis glycosyltransferase